MIDPFPLRVDLLQLPFWLKPKPLSRYDVRFRLSAGAIVINQGKILLVKHGGPLHGSEFLVAPGGGVEGEESFVDAGVRETREETGLDVVPQKLLAVEDMISSQKRIIKCWFLCDVVGGQLIVAGQTAEGVVEAG
jgi:8-oxo-dGTP diphosphatase